MDRIPSIEEITARAKAINVSTAKLFAKAHMAPQTYYRWRDREFEPKLRTLRSVVEALEELEREAHLSRQREECEEVPQESAAPSAKNVAE